MDSEIGGGGRIDSRRKSEPSDAHKKAVVPSGERLGVDEINSRIRRFMNRRRAKRDFARRLHEFTTGLNAHIASEDGQWTIKGFIDLYKNIYTISSDTKIISKILEIHLFPRFLEFAEENGFKIVLAEHQNYYPDISFVSKGDDRVKFAVDLKTTYRLPEYPDFCNGFTLGSHGKYFLDRKSRKNIQFPYGEYLAHFCLGIIYTRSVGPAVEETKSYELDDLHSITSVIRDFQFFVAEKWRIASENQGSKNTANIGSITRISDVRRGKGMFSRLGEDWFDDYWMNYGKISISTVDGKTKRITKLRDFVQYRGGDVSLIVPKPKKTKSKRRETQ